MYYKIVAAYTLSNLGVQSKKGDMKPLTRSEYLNALEELMRKGFSYDPSSQTWKRINEDDSTDMAYFADYIYEL